MKARKGFTLIEIIVVLIILGVLAALAIPSYFDWITKCKSAEGLTSIMAMRARVETCLSVHPENILSCLPAPETGTECSVDTLHGLPTEQCVRILSPGSPNFDYQVWTGLFIDSVTAANENIYHNDPDSSVLYATYTAEGYWGTDYIEISHNRRTGQTSCFAFGKMAGVC